MWKSKILFAISKRKNHWHCFLFYPQIHCENRTGANHQCKHIPHINIHLSNGGNRRRKITTDDQTLSGKMENFLPRFSSSHRWEFCLMEWMAMDTTMAETMSTWDNNHHLYFKIMCPTTSTTTMKLRAKIMLVPVLCVLTLVCWYFPSPISSFDLSRLFSFFRLSNIFIENENKWEFFISRDWSERDKIAILSIFRRLSLE